MNEMIVRILTGVVAGAVFITSYLFLPKLFVAGLICLMVYMIFFEWARLCGGLASWYFWLTAPLYPFMPFLVIILLITNTYHDNKLLGLYPFGLAWVHDTASYFVGKLFGRHRLVPTISPNKTGEGLAGGLIGVTLFNYAVLGYLPAVRSSILYPYVTLSVAGTAVAFAGDIFVSWVKRKAGVNDTGSLLPGHGGLLDRFDAVLFVAVFVWWLVW